MLVEQKAAIEVAIPSDTQIRAVSEYGLAGGRAVLLEQRIGNTVGEVAVGLVMHPDKLERQMRRQRVQRYSRAAVAGVHHDAQRLEGCHVHVAQQMLHIAAARFGRAQAAARSGRREAVFLGKALDVQQAGVAADRARAFAHELHAVVVLGVVAGRDGDATVDAHVEGGEVDFLGAALADIEHIDAGLEQPLGERIADFAAAQADIVTHHNRAGFHHLRVGAPDAAGDIGVQLVGYASAYVVGLETREFDHRTLPVLLGIGPEL